MPRMNKWLADRMQNLFASQFHPVEVTETEQACADLKRVRFQGALQSVDYLPGNVIEFRINDEDFRHYTPALFDRDNGICDVLFYLHDLGVGSRWAKQLTAGDQTFLMGPGNKMAYQYQYAEHVLFGDESSLGFVLTMAKAAECANQSAHCVLELDAAHAHWPKQFGIDATLVAKNTLAADIEQLDALPASAAYYLTGRARSIQVFKRHLKHREVPRKQVQTMPYWADGKHGL
ncbi:MAG: siderophore-interacting protein [Pseudomonadota bacterium]